MGYRIGVDIGGTFTDLLVADGEREARVYKAPTTPGDPTVGFFRGLERAAADLGSTLADLLAQVETIVHGTTITTIAVLTGEGATTGFVTTKGFRDVLNMRRGLKARQFDKYPPPPALVPRHRIRVVEERITLDGAVMTPLREDDVRDAARALREEHVDAVAVSCLWSFRNPAHEERIGEILQEELPDAYVSLSTEVLPQIRVYERHSTTALNAYVGPVLKRYEYWPDSAGAGEWRGGLGTMYRFRVDAPAIAAANFGGGNRPETAPFGLEGGLAAPPHELRLHKASGETITIDAEVFYDLGEGDEYEILQSRGGGYGDPGKRDPALVARDVRDGVVSAEAARGLYGR